MATAQKGASPAPAKKSIQEQLAALDRALSRLDHAIDGLTGDGQAVAAPEETTADVPQATVAPPDPSANVARPVTGDLMSGRPAPSPAPGPDQLALMPSRALQPALQGTQELDSEQLRLLTRFLSGSALFGWDELLGRLRHWQAEADLAGGPVEGKPLAEATSADMARYFVLGSLAWGRRQMVKAAYGGFRRSAQTTADLARTADRLTDNRLLRPVRQPVEDALARVAQGAALRIQEGWQEEQISRWLAEQTIEEIVDDSIDYISENPQLADLVRDQISAQSLGMAGTVVGSGRHWSVIADDLVVCYQDSHGSALLPHKVGCSCPGACPRAVQPLPGFRFAPVKE